MRGAGLTRRRLGRSAGLGRSAEVVAFAGTDRRLLLSIASYFALLALLAVGCSRSEIDPLAAVLPGADVVAGWAPAGDVVIYDQESVFDLVNGQADAFFAFGFDRVAVQHYKDTEDAVLGIEVWQLATPADAYGLFSTSITGAPVDIGRDGDTDPGWRLIFWQDRYYAQIRARQELLDSVLRDFGEAVSAALPSGGERPALIERLPPERLVPRSIVFFHKEISIQNQVWLGGENILGLGPDTEGALAQYDHDVGMTRLLLVRYPNAERASAGLAALSDGTIENLVLADADGDLVGAIFGPADETVASDLLSQSLATR